MDRAVEFLFDFGSPNAYLAFKVLERFAAPVRIVPVLLGGLFKLTNNQAPMLAFAGVKGKMAYEMLETQRFIAKHGLSKFSFNPHFPVNTLLVMRGLVAAQRMGVADTYLRVVLAAMWEDGRNMADAAEAEQVLAEGGLDGAALLAATREDAVKAELLANTEAAAARGAFGIPTFFVGNEMFFGKERLDQVMEALAAG